MLWRLRFVGVQFQQSLGFRVEGWGFKIGSSWDRERTVYLAKSLGDKFQVHPENSSPEPQTLAQGLRGCLHILGSLLRSSFTRST